MQPDHGDKEYPAAQAPDPPMGRDRTRNHRPDGTGPAVARHASRPALPRNARSPHRRMQNKWAESGTPEGSPATPSPGRFESSRAARISRHIPQYTGASEHPLECVYQLSMTGPERRRPRHKHQVVPGNNRKDASGLAHPSLRPVPHHGPLRQALTYRESPPRGRRIVAYVAQHEKRTADDSPLRVRAIELSPLAEPPSSLHNSVLDDGQPLASP